MIQSENPDEEESAVERITNAAHALYLNGAVIHHINGNPGDNSPDNLMLVNPCENIFVLASEQYTRELQRGRPEEVSFVDGVVWKRGHP